MASRQSRNSQQSYTDDGWATSPNKPQSHATTTTDESDYDGYTPVPNNMRQSSRVSRQKPAHPLLRRRTPVSRSNSRSQSSNRKRKSASKKTPKKAEVGRRRSITRIEDQSSQGLFTPQQLRRTPANKSPSNSQSSSQKKKSALKKTPKTEGRRTITLTEDESSRGSVTPQQRRQSQSNSRSQSSSRKKKSALKKTPKTEGRRHRTSTLTEDESSRGSVTPQQLRRQKSALKKTPTIAKIEGRGRRRASARTEDPNLNALFEESLKSSSRRHASARESGSKKVDFNVSRSGSSRRYPATPGLQQQHSNSSSNRGSSQRSRPSPHLITTECFSSPDCTGIWIKVPQNMIQRAIPHLYAPKGPSKPTPKPLNFDSDDNSVFEELNRKPLAHSDWEKMLGKQNRPKLPFGLKGLSEAWQEAHPGWRDGRYDVNRVAPTKDEVSVSPKEVIDPLKLQVSHRRFGGPGERERAAIAAQDRQELARNDILYRGMGGRY